MEKGTEARLAAATAIGPGSPTRFPKKRNKKKKKKKNKKEDTYKNQTKQNKYTNGTVLCYKIKR